MLLIDANGQVTECHRSNIFFIRNGKLFTPSVELVLPGITRQKVINLARQHRIPFEERHIPFSTISDYDSCFISSTSKSVLPIRQIDSKEFKIPDPVTLRLSDYYKAFVANHLASFRWD